MQASGAGGRVGDPAPIPMRQRRTANTIATMPNGLAVKQPPKHGGRPPFHETLLLPMEFGLSSRMNCEHQRERHRQFVNVHMK